MNNLDLFIDEAIEPLTRHYSNIEMQLIKKLIENLLIGGEFTNSDYWRLKKIDEIGLLNRDLINYISQETGTTPRKIKKMMESIGYKALNYDSWLSAFNDGLIEVNPEVLLQNHAVENIIKHSYNELTKSFIELSNNIIDSARKTYLSMVEEAYLKTATGTHSYQEAMKEAIDKLTSQGITTLTYQTTDRNGNTITRTYDIEGVVRRDVLNATRSLADEVIEETIDTLKPELVKLSEHLDCRPQHLDWQGLIVRREDWKEITNYGAVDGLKGINCRHYETPYFEDAELNGRLNINGKQFKVSRGEKKLDKKDCDKAYKIRQHQRYLERGIRKYKRREEALKDVNRDEALEEYYQRARAKKQEWIQRNKRFTEKYGIKRDFSRERVGKK